MGVVRLKQIAQDGAANGQVATWNNSLGVWEPQTPGGGRVYQPGVILDAARFAIDFNNQSSWEPNQTTTWIDTLGGVSGTATNTTISGGHLNFNGTTSEVDFGTLTSDLENIFAGGGTIAVWVRPEGAGEGGFGRIIDTTGGGSEGYVLYTRDDGGAGAGEVEFSFGSGGGRNWRTTNAFATDTWYFVTVTWDSGSPTTAPTVRVNDVVQPLDDLFGSGYGSDAGNPLIVGNNPAGSRTFDGDIEMLLMFDQTRNSAQSDTWNATKGRFGYGTAASWSEVLAVGNTSGANNPSIDDGQAIISDDTTTVGVKGGSYTVRAGDPTSAMGGNLTVRAGASTDTGPGIGNYSKLILSAGEIKTNALSAQLQSLLMHGSDHTGSNTAGGVEVRGGNSVTGPAGRLVLQGGSTGFSGDSLIGGYLWLRSGETTGISSNVWMTTSNNNGGGGRTGSIWIDTANVSSEPTNTGGPGYLTNATGSTGSINIRTGNTSFTTNAVPGNINITGGTAFNGGGSGNQGATVNITAGDSGATGNLRSPGSVNITAGDNLGTDLGKTSSPAGSITLQAGDSSTFAATSPAGSVNIFAGSNTATVASGGQGGDVNIGAGNGTNAKRAGNVNLTAGTGGTGGGNITMGGPVTLASYTVAGVPAASNFTAAMIYVTDETGGAVPAFSDGTNWRRVTDRAIIA